MAGRDRGEPSAREVQVAMRDVGYGGFGPGGGGWT
jgi:hypothetical protein